MPSKKTIGSNLISKKPGYYRPRRKKSPKKEETTPASTSSGATELPRVRNFLSQEFLERVEDARSKFPPFESTEEYVQFFKHVGYEAEKNPMNLSYDRIALSSDPRFDTHLEKALSLPPGYITELTELRGVSMKMHKGKKQGKEKKQEKGKKQKGGTNQENAESINTVYPKRSIASSQFKGEIHLWLLPELIISHEYDIKELPNGTISKLADGRCWRGEGEGFPGDLCVFGARRNVVRLLGIEVDGDPETANVIALAAFSVTDHAKYKACLTKLRGQPNILKASIQSCKAAWRQNTLATLVNDPIAPYQPRLMGEEEGEEKGQERKEEGGKGEWAEEKQEWDWENADEESPDVTDNELL